MIAPMQFPEESFCNEHCICLRSGVVDGVKVFKCAKYNEELTGVLLAPATSHIAKLLKYLCPAIGLPLKYQVLRCERCLHSNEEKS